MTPPTQDNLAAGRELDALVAEKVLGMRVERVRPPWYQGGRVEVLCFYAPGFDHMEYSYDANSCNAMMYRNGRDSSDGTAPTLPNYSDDIAAAWQVAESIYPSYVLHIVRRRTGVWECIIERRESPILWASSIAETAPLAICAAALKAVSA